MAKESGKEIPQEQLDKIPVIDANGKPDGYSEAKELGLGACVQERKGAYELVGKKGEVYATYDNEKEAKEALKRQQFKAVWKTVLAAQFKG